MVRKKKSINVGEVTRNKIRLMDYQKQLEHLEEEGKNHYTPKNGRLRKKLQKEIKKLGGKGH